MSRFLMPARWCPTTSVGYSAQRRLALYELAYSSPLMRSVTPRRPAPMKGLMVQQDFLSFFHGIRQRILDALSSISIAVHRTRPSPLGRNLAVTYRSRVFVTFFVRGALILRFLFLARLTLGDVADVTPDRFFGLSCLVLGDTRPKWEIEPGASPALFLLRSTVGSSKARSHSPRRTVRKDRWPL